MVLNEKNQYHSIDIGGDDKKIAVAGKLKQIELWDLHRMVMEQCWTKDEKHCHDNSVFTARFFPYNHFNMYSGGWDRVIKFWDVRYGGVTGFAHGSQTCADSLDMEVTGHLLVSGGGTHGEGVQIWDIRNLQGPVLKLEFSPGEIRNPKIEPFINCCRFIPRTKHILVAATDANFPAKIFNYQTGELIDKFYNTCGRATSCDVAHRDGNMVVVGDSTGLTQTISTVRKMDKKKKPLKVINKLQD